jgi:hypothetical protein
MATEMLATLSENYTRRLRGSSMQPPYLRYCPCCVEDDRLTYGEAYWHRLHQLAVVHVCPKHGVFLNNSEVQRAVMTPWYVTSAEQAVNSTVRVKSPDRRQPYAALLLWLAAQSQWLLDQQETSWEREGVSKRYQYHLSLAGFCGQQGTIAIRALQERFVQKLPHFPSPADGLNDRKNLYLNLFRLVTMGNGQPSGHLLLIWMLGLSVGNFLNGNCEYFEAGPWPCLNPRCPYSKSAGIHTYEKQRNRDGLLLGAFSCRCGFVYLRRAPDDQGTTRHSPTMVLEPATVYGSARPQLNSPHYTIESIAQTIGISKQSAKTFVQKLQLRLKKRTMSGHRVGRPRQAEELEVTRLRYRAKLLKVLEENPGCSRNDLNKSVSPCRMVWLRHNDNPWLEHTLPPARQITSSIDWHQRDVDLSLGVADAKQRLLCEEERFTRRITAQRIIRVLGFSIGLPDPERLPITVSKINEAAETPRECTIRRIRRLIMAAGPRIGSGLFPTSS